MKKAGKVDVWDIGRNEQRWCTILPTNNEFVPLLLLIKAMNITFISFTIGIKVRTKYLLYMDDQAFTFVEYTDCYIFRLFSIIYHIDYAIKLFIFQRLFSFHINCLQLCTAFIWLFFSYAPSITSCTSRKCVSNTTSMHSYLGCHIHKNTPCKRRKTVTSWHVCYTW